MHLELRRERKEGDREVGKPGGDWISGELPQLRSPEGGYGVFQRSVNLAAQKQLDGAA